MVEPAIKAGVGDASSSQKLKRLCGMPDGLIYPGTPDSHKPSVLKQGHQLQLMFLDGRSGEVQSRLDLNDPLFLVSPYTQAMMLGLAWKSHPEKIHVIGLGAGRIPMVLRACFPSLQIDCTETNHDVLEVAQEFFGLELDSQLRVFLKDGRKFLQELDPAVRYDLIMIDAFDGTGSSPFPLCTREFYEECTRHLSKDGLVIANLLLADKRYLDKVKTFRACFSDTWMVSTDEWGGTVFFGSREHHLSRQEIIEKAQQLQQAHNFSFPLAEHASRIADADRIDELMLLNIKKTRILTDLEPINNHPCPCGSGKKYKKCHGRT